MKSFLKELAERVHKEYPSWEGLTLVFPNRRATLYFKKYLSMLLVKPAFTPSLITIEDFIAARSVLKVPDKLELIHRLYKVYHRTIVRYKESNADIEPFHQFYFWGEMLLRDFDEVDKYMINADLIFKDLSHQKELDSNFDFFTEEQREFLKNFWGSFDDNMSAHKKRFIDVWKQLAHVYHSFKEQLQSEGFAYEGMLQRAVAESLLHENYSPKDSMEQNPTLLFAGFNALSIAEEQIISYFVSQGIATVVWDIDAYYFNNNTIEAGKFLRQYQQHSVLGRTFPTDVPSNLKNFALGDERTISIIGASQPMGQAKLMSQILQEEIQKGILPEETLIVLPDEKLLLPVLHGVSGMVDHINVTMGFPLANTPLFNLIELLIDLHVNRKGDDFNHRQVTAVLGHPYVVAAEASASDSKRKEIIKHNWVYIPPSWLATGPLLHQLIFVHIRSHHLDIINYIQSIVVEIASLEKLNELDKEYAFQFYKFFNRVKKVLDDEQVASEKAVGSPVKKREVFRSFLRLFRQLMRNDKIPFTGEPLRGLQVMGVLETRNLDFKNVFILSLNEGAFPSFNSKGSYIPYNIRKAYALPTAEHQDAIYSYLFYRVLQRAQNVFLFYNSETDVLGQGEMSRYLQQLIHESGLPIEKRMLHNTILPNPIIPITIYKDERIWNQLATHCLGNPRVKELTPTALNDYLECRLKFYLKYVAGIREAREVEEDLDARVLGNFLHKVMELFYQQVTRAKQSNVVERGDFDGYINKVTAIIDRVFTETYKLDPEKTVEYEGQRLIVKEVIIRFVDRIIEVDKRYAPFTLEAIEGKGLRHYITLDTEGKPVVVLSGIIDRADRKADLIRVIDYKTGKDTAEIKGGVKDLFQRDNQRNKAAFQTMLYALLFARNFPSEDPQKLRIVPGLLNRVNLFDDNFRFGLKIGKEYVSDVVDLLPEFELGLKTLLEELYDPAVPFDQTTNVEICRICPFHEICYR